MNPFRKLFLPLQIAFFKESYFITVYYNHEQKINSDNIYRLFFIMLNYLPCEKYIHQISPLSHLKDFSHLIGCMVIDNAAHRQEVI